VALAWGTVSVPVTSVAGAADVGLGCAAAGALSELGGAPGVGAGASGDCRPIGVGDVIDGSTGPGAAGLFSLSTGSGVSGVASLEMSFETSLGGDGGEPPSSSVIAILKELSTITTTLAATRNERIFEVMVEDPCAGRVWFWSGLEPRLVFSPAGAAAAAWAARRAAAMKFEVLACSREPEAISLMAFSEAAIRSYGEAIRPSGRVPGSSG
jgi:hypothetical protein